MPVSGKDNKQGGVDIEKGASPTDGGGGAAEREVNIERERPRQRRALHRVPPKLRESNIYEPSVVSLGPYHHGRRPHLRQYEDFKAEAVNIILKSEGGAEDKGLLFRSKILEGVDEIRSFYGGLSKEEYKDEALVEMMVRDACLLLYHMKIGVADEEITSHAIQSIGAIGLTMMSDDFSRLENQIPWWIIKSLISSTCGDDEGRRLIRRYLSFVAFWDYGKLQNVAWKEGTDEEPLHLLEARRRTLLKKKINNDIHTVSKGISRHLPCHPADAFRWCRRRKSQRKSLTELIKSPFRSATELKAKGIHFRPTSGLLNDIRFSSHSFHGVLHLPVLHVDKETTTFFSNVIVLEMSPGSTSAKFPVTSYVNFMKSLIEDEKDVKLLQEKEVLVSYLQDNEQIVQMFKDIDTHNLDDVDIFREIKKEINEHCDDKGKTWIAELIDTHFRSPWTALALLIATFLLGLTLFQAYDSLVLQRK